MTAGDRVAGRFGLRRSGPAPPTWPDMTQLGTGRDRRPERGELDRVEAGPVLGRPTASPWWVSTETSPRPGKCLTAAATPAELQAADHRRAERAPTARRIVAERADPERRVGRVGGDVEDRGVDDVDAHRPQPRCRSPRPTRSASAGVADRARGPCCRRTRVGRVAERLELAALLVGRDERAVGAAAAAPPRRPPGARVGELADLAGRAHVGVPEDGHPGGRRRRQPGGHPVRAAARPRRRA